MNNCVISFKARATGPDLHLIAYVNRKLIYSSDLNENELVTISHEFDDSEPKKNTLFIIMKGKTIDHTQLDAAGNITSDRVIEISDVAIDDIELGIVFQNLSRYTHDFNGTADKTTEQFFGIMGCNGNVELEFDSPVYQWLLENM